uniref:NfeD family protein n=1 Tax=Desulfobacca sp. TaxID=2067990 RepID=UPI0040490972
MVWLWLGCLVLVSSFLPARAAAADAGEVFVLTASGSINPGMAEFILDGLQAAEQQQAVALIIELDTPGGLDASMRQIAQGIINAKVPVVVFVAPKGARAASAGLIITLASHVAAMAPGTNIGAAHPVAIGTGQMDKEMAAKVVNDMAAYVRSLAAERQRNADWAEKAVRQSVSVTAVEAQKLRVVEILADDLPDLLKKLDGRVVRLQQEDRTLKTAKAQVVTYDPALRHRVLKRLADPNIAIILMMIGLAGLYFELAHPGAVLPGVLGGICLLLAFYAFQTLPVNFIGLMLLILGVIFFILEIYVTSYGLLSIAGLISLALGGLMLYRSQGPGMAISLSVLLTVIGTISLFFLVVTGLAVRAQLRRPMSGLAGLVGERGIALTDLHPTGKVLVQGTYWDAQAAEFIPKEAPIEVVQVHGLRLVVRRSVNF